MPVHLLNCFEISNADALCADYRLVDVEGPFDPSMGDGDVADRNRQQLLQRIAYDERIPVGLYSGGRQPVLAVPASHNFQHLEFDLAPDVATLHPRASQEELCLGSLTDETRGIGFSFLGWHIRSPLRVDGRLWSAGPWTYFQRRPLNYKNDNRDVDVFGGFGLRLGMRDGRLCIWVKLSHRYVESAWLPDAYGVNQLQEQLRMHHALYHYGHRWFRVQILGPTGKSISEQRFIPNGSENAVSVYDYTKREVGGPKAPAWIESLDPKSPAITYQYPGNKLKRYGAAALCKIMRATDDSRVSRVHHFSINAPDRRFEQIGRVVKTFLQGVSFQGNPIAISTSPLRTRRRVFSVPAQAFGQGLTMHVGPDAGAGEIRLQDLGRKRLEMLLDPRGGVATSSPLDAQYLIVPDSQPRPVVEDFQKRLEQTTRGFLQRSFSFARVLYNDQGTRNLKKQVESIVAAIDKASVVSGRGVLMLPTTAESDLHNFVKKKLQDRVQVQCVAAQSVAEFYDFRSHNGQAVYAVRDGMTNRYVSYLRYTAMGLLLVNRQWPWVLEKETHYDLYIGLDVLHSTAAFTFFSEGGRQCFLRSVESQQKEKLLRKQVRSVIYEHLKSHLKTGVRTPRSIVLRRDGRSFGSERNGFREAIQKLVDEGLLPTDVQHGVIEMHKTSAEGFRLVEEVNDRTLRNPCIGAWEVIDANEGIVCTTGFPFHFKGTVNPLVLRIVIGDLDLEKALEDTFAMSQLCWPVPDRCMRLSVDLKLCDDHLRSIAAKADDDEGQFGDEEEEWAEQDERAAAGWGT
jgi:hypothetical protein